MTPQEALTGLLDRLGWCELRAADYTVEQLQQMAFEHVEMLEKRARKQEQTRIAESVIYKDGDIKIRCLCTARTRTEVVQKCGHGPKCLVHVLLCEGENE